LCWAEASKNSAAFTVAVGPLDRILSMSDETVSASTIQHSAKPPTRVGRWAFYLVALIAIAALACAVTLWQRLSSIQEQLARQSADSGTRAIEARTIAKQALDTAQDAANRIGVTEARVSEVAMQRTQLEELMQSLSRSRDENLVVDLESSIRLAQQQADLTGSVAPLLAALQSADQRVERAAQPRLGPVQRAIRHDIEVIKSASTTDIPGLLSRLDEMTRMVDELPLQNAVAHVRSSRSVMPVRIGLDPLDDRPATNDDATLPWWRRVLDRAWYTVRDEARGLIRVSRVDNPEAILLAPNESFFLRENLKLKLVNARLGVLARQNSAARADLAAATMAINKYFDPAARRVQSMATLMQQAQAQMRHTELPRPDETLAALATAAAGR
jgi:uroporphyrin-3 C-methyltransferase